MSFLFMLPFNNTTELLPENKIKYRELISEPLGHLFNEIAPVALSVSPGIEAKPSRCISSMYNDRRFSRGTPLKTYMYLRFRETCREEDVLGLYFDMGCDDYSYGLRIYNQTSAGMRIIRDDAVNNGKKYSEALSEVLSSGASILGDSFAKDHYPGLDDKVLKELLNRKGFHICYRKNVADPVFSRELAEEIKKGYYSLEKIYRLLKKAMHGEGRIGGKPLFGGED